MSKIHVNDIGTDFRVTIVDNNTAVDISSATSKTITFQKPNGVSVEKTATFVTDGSDGKIRYITVDGDLDDGGTWKIQGKVVTPAGSWNTDVESFRVYDNV
jgi:hypothetical protein